MLHLLKTAKNWADRMGLLQLSHPCGMEPLPNAEFNNGDTAAAASRALTGAMVEGMVMMAASRIACVTGAIAGMLLLTACGGSNVNLSSPAVSTKLQQALTKVSMSPDSVSGLVAGNSPLIGSAGNSGSRVGIVSQSSVADSSKVGVTADSVTTEFDGKDVKFNILRAGANPATVLAVDSSTAKVKETGNYVRVWSGYNTRKFILLNEDKSSLELASVDVHWKNDDDTDYFAAGYWADLDGYSSGSGYSSGEIGAFVTGSEFELDSSDPDLPTANSAAYRGRSVGHYGYKFSRNGVTYNQAGDYSAAAVFSADFAKGEVSGCVGCGSGFLVTGVETVGAGVQRRFTNNKLGYDLKLGAVKYSTAGSDSLPKGSFQGTAVTLDSVYGDVSSATGSWGGRFSSKFADKEPRAVAGTLGVSWSEDLDDADTGTGQLTGAWYGFGPKAVDPPSQQ